MPKVIINGTIGAVLKSTELDFDPTRGLVTHLEYESAGPNLAGWFTNFINQGIACRWVNHGVKSSLQVTISGGYNGTPDLAQTNWQLLANEIQVSIFESGIALFAEASFPGTLAAVRSAFAAAESGDSATADDIRDTVDSGALAAFDKLIGFLLRGTTHYAAGQYALKRTISVSNFYTGTLPGEGFDETIIDTASILTLGMPSPIASKISSIVIPASPAGYFWGWRQLPSTVVTGAYNRSEVSTEWWLDRWSTDLYAVA